MNVTRAARAVLQPAYAAYLSAVYGRKGLPWRVNGDALRIDPRLRWMLPHENEPLLYEYLRRGISPGQAVLDIGAFLGTYAMAEARWVGPSGHVLAIEPTPWTFARLRRHVDMNGLGDRLEVRCAAVGARPGTAALRLFADEPYRNEVAAVADPEAIEVDVVTVDALCRAWGRFPDWIRMDVQGREFEVLEGAREVLRERRGRVGIVVEVHPEEWAGRGIGSTEAVDRFAAVGLRAVPLPGAPPLFTESAHVTMEYL